MYGHWDFRFSGLAALIKRIVVVRSAKSTRTCSHKTHKVLLGGSTFPRCNLGAFPNNRRCSRRFPWTARRSIIYEAGHLPVKSLALRSFSMMFAMLMLSVFSVSVSAQEATPSADNSPNPEECT